MNSLIRQIEDKYNNPQVYIGNDIIKNDVSNLVKLYVDTDKQYNNVYPKLQKNELYQLQNNTQTQKQQIINQINNISGYIHDNKTIYINKLGLNSNHIPKYEQPVEPRTKYAKGGLEVVPIANNNEPKIINNGNVKCNKCLKIGIGVMMIPGQNQTYTCPMCMHTPSVDPKYKLCLQLALQNGYEGINLDKKVQECMLNDKVSLNEIDLAYIKKHNELMTMYKAYQKLYEKTLDYKNQLSTFKAVRVDSILTREQLSKMVKDQEDIMNGLDTMQKNMVKEGILTENELVPVHQYTGKEVHKLNNGLQNQIGKIVAVDKIDNYTKQGVVKLMNNVADHKNIMIKIEK